MTSLPPDAPKPRLCHVRKDYPDQDYGFNLHADRNKGQFIGAVDAESPASVAGLKSGDRIIAVNGVAVGSEAHKQVVARIKENVMQCSLLVIDEAGETWYRDHKLPIPLITVAGDADNALSCGHSRDKTSDIGEDHSTNNEAEGVSLTNSEVSSSASNIAMRPRLCRLIKPNSDAEFGFNLHAEKNIGHYIGKVDRGSLAEKAGLEEGQRIVGANGILIYQTTPNREVVQVIKSDPMKTELLVVFPEVDQWYQKHGKEFNFEDAEIFESSISHQSHSVLTETPSALVENGTASVETSAKQAVPSSHATAKAQTVSVLSTSPEIPKPATDHNEDHNGWTRKEKLPDNASHNTKSNPSPGIENGGHKSSSRPPQDWMSLSAAELRERVSRHKKTDPRTQQLSLLQKYEIIDNL